MRNIYIAAAIGLIIIASTIAYAMRNNMNTQTEMTSTIPEQPIEEVEENISLTGTPWVWLHTELPDGNMISTPAREKYILMLHDDMTLTSSTDCNTFSGEYIQDEEVLSVKPLISTKMYCEESLEQMYAEDLELTTSYTIQGRRLYLNLNRDVGKMVFEKQ